MRTVLERFQTRRLIIFSRDELKQYEMQQILGRRDRHPGLRFFIGDVRDRQRLEISRGYETTFNSRSSPQARPSPNTIPANASTPNVLGAENVVHAALSCGVKRVIALSTDKAANPVNL